MKKTDVMTALSRVSAVKAQWSEAQVEFTIGVNSLMRRLLFEAAANKMSAEEVALASGFTKARVRIMMRNAGLDPKSSKSLLSQQAAEALANNAALMSIDPSEMDLMSPLAYLPMGSEMRKSLAAEQASQVHEVSGNWEDTVTHIVISNESGVWCREDCPRPEAECGALAVVWNAR